MFLATQAAPTRFTVAQKKNTITEILNLVRGQLGHQGQDKDKDEERKERGLRAVGYKGTVERTLEERVAHRAHGNTSHKSNSELGLLFLHDQGDQQRVNMSLIGS